MYTLSAGSRSSDLRFLDGAPAPILPFRLADAGLIEAAAPFLPDLPWDTYDAPRARVRFLKTRFPDHSDRLDRYLRAVWSGHAEPFPLDPLVERLSPDDQAAFAAIRPYRRRAIARFRLAPRGDGWRIERTPVAGFTQKSPVAGDPRSLRRVFAPWPDDLAAHPSLRAVLSGIGDVVRSLRPEMSGMVCTAHLMRVECAPGRAATNAPEGVHQDGADYIVSALVLERDGIAGGQSRVLGAARADGGRDLYLATTLEVGQGLFQADAGSPLWHDVTPIAPLGERVGIRSILGLDIRVT